MRQALAGRHVRAVEGVFPEDAIGRRIDAVERHGKFIVLRLDAGMMFVHLGMTGQLMVSDDAGKFTRGRMYLDGVTVRYDDIRKFGRVFLATEYPERGPDPLAMTAEEFVAIAKPRKARIKALLLDQRFVAGMGNIYADEALFAAGVHPCAAAAGLSAVRLKALHAAMVEVLEAAIAAGGSSISDYVNARGERGSFQQQHQVYGKHGEPCPRCGAELKRMLVTQRGTTYCPHCQKR